MNATPPTYQPGAPPEVQAAFIKSVIGAAVANLSAVEGADDPSSPRADPRPSRTGAPDEGLKFTTHDRRMGSGSDKTDKGKKKPRDAANKWTPKDPKDWLYDKKGNPAGILKRAFLDRTDLGMAQRLSYYAGSRIRYCDRLGWLSWDGHRFDLEGGEALARIEVTKMIDKIKYEEFPAFVAHGMTEAEQRLKYGPAYGDKAAMKLVDIAVKSGERAGNGSNPAEAAKKMRARTNGLIAAGVKLGDSAKQKSVLDTAATLPAFRVEFDQLDSAPFEISTPAGVLVLPGPLSDEEAAALENAPRELTAEMEPEVDKTRDQVAAEIFAASLKLAKIRKSSPEDETLPTRMTKASPDLEALLADSASTPQWDAHTQKILPNRNVRQSVQRILGSLLVNYNPKDSWFILRGPGGDGKSVTMRAIAAVMGDYARTGDVQTLMHDSRQSAAGPREDLVRLSGGTRLAVFSEPNQGDELSLRTIKTISGGDEISTRKGYKEQFEFFPQFKMVMMCNPRPRIKGDDEGIWRRTNEIPFNRQLSRAEMDPDIERKLAAEIDGILLYLIEGYLDWRARGFDYEFDQVILDKTEQYRKEASPLHAWITDRIIWGRWYNWTAIAEYDPHLEGGIREGDEDAIETAKSVKGLMTSDPEVYKPPRYKPTEDIFGDFSAWCDNSGLDPWRPNSFSPQFANKATDQGAARGKTGALGWYWSGFTFVTGDPVRPEGDGDD